MNESRLRYGNIAAIYYEIAGIKLPKQLDMIDTWFPGLIIAVDESDGNEKVQARYEDCEYMIHAVRHSGALYSGGSTRISQILGRLTGTASGNQEKERRTAQLIREHAAERFAMDMELTPCLKKNAADIIGALSEGQRREFSDRLNNLIEELASSRAAKSVSERKEEAAPMDDETYGGVLYNAAYQLNLGSFTGICNAYLWLLTGSLLRNEAGRILRMYDSAFIAVNRRMSETGELTDELNYLTHPELYEYTYDGDDLENRFPGVEWYCDRCGAHLNEQEGFDDHRPEWKCAACGYINKLDISEIYDNEEDWHSHVRQTDPEKFAEAIKRRRKL